MTIIIKVNYIIIKKYYIQDFEYMQETTDVIMPLSIVLIMFGIGLELRFKDFERVVALPKGMITGIISQLLLLPLVAFLLVFFWTIDPLFKLE